MTRTSYPDPINQCLKYWPIFPRPPTTSTLAPGRTPVATRAVPMGRAGEPHEIGPLAVYLASPASSYVTGASFVIDGGYTLW